MSLLFLQSEDGMRLENGQGGKADDDTDYDDERADVEKDDDVRIKSSDEETITDAASMSGQDERDAQGGEEPYIDHCNNDHYGSDNPNSHYDDNQYGNGNDHYDGDNDNDHDYSNSTNYNHDYDADNDHCEISNNQFDEDNNTHIISGQTGDTDKFTVNFIQQRTQQQAFQSSGYVKAEKIISKDSSANSLEMDVPPDEQLETKSRMSSCSSATTVRCGETFDLVTDDEGNDDDEKGDERPPHAAARKIQRERNEDAAEGYRGNKLSNNHVDRYTGSFTGRIVLVVVAMVASGVHFLTQRK